MGLFYIRNEGKAARLGLWLITESVEELLRMKQVSEEEKSVFNSFMHDNRKKEWLVSRILIEKMTGKKNSRIIYDPHSKPFLEGSEKHISLSHSHQLLTAIVDDAETGIDIEFIKPNVKKIKEKFMSDDELKAVGKDNLAEQLTLYWCVKESLYKYYGKKKLTFKENLLVDAFEYKEKGIITARIHHETMKKKFELNYETVAAGGNKYMLAYIVKEV